MAAYRIGEISKKLDLSADTLRYYEKIGLLTSVARTSAGTRFYTDRNVATLQFIRRAQRMNFTLAEIGRLLKMREAPRQARAEARKLARHKLSEIEAHLNDLNTLRDELLRLLNRCECAESGCPIIENFDQRTPVD